MLALGSILLLLSLVLVCIHISIYASKILNILILIERRMRHIKIAVAHTPTNTPK